MDDISRADCFGLELYERACQTAVEVEHMRFAWVGAVDQAHSRIVPVASAGHECGYLKGRFVDLNDTAQCRSPAGRAARDGQLRAIFDVARDPDYWPWMIDALARGYRSIVALPIRLGGKVVAVLCLYAPTPGRFDIVEVRRLEWMTDGVTRGLEAIIAART